MKLLKKEKRRKQRIRKTKAKTFQIVNPYKGMGDLVGWLDTGITSDPLGKRGEAAVRDIGNTLEVLVLQQRGGDYFMLPWLAKQGGRRIPVLEPPGEELAKALAECSIQLPHALCYKLDDTIEALEKIALGDLPLARIPTKGELFLVLDEDYTAELCGYHLQYDRWAVFKNREKEMGMEEKTFNLLREPWILVLNWEGRPEEVSLLTVLERAHEYRCLAGELPTQDVVILRLILAALYATFSRADAEGRQKLLDNGEEALKRWKSLWEQKRFPIEPIKKRLCLYEDRFYLFHPERPFYQVAGLERGTNYSAANY